MRRARRPAGRRADGDDPGPPRRAGDAAGHAGPRYAWRARSTPWRHRHMKKALVVEDDPDIVELIAHYLRAEGFEVEAARRRPLRARAPARRQLPGGRARPAAAGHGRAQPVRGDPARQAHAVAARDHADRARRRGRSDRGPRGRGRRLRRQALQPEGARRPRAGPPAPGREAGGGGRGPAARRLARDRRDAPPRAMEGRGRAPDREGVRPPPRPRRGPRPRALPPVAARGHLGLQLRGGDEDGGRPRPSPAGEAARPRRSGSSP